ncbi:AmpG family muropeptide MFS transporter [Neiella marina]|uniref:AmpG family muropeptide MFS transporter n=1 Tax=Neiella holothuriorum TaxID=2870530 RepID=A0ABS7EHU7_9GAMM|nr:AmpG family muropeptide MFS transporter [Neiella holothuriorum]MBW8191795.1 AmpG family muropeptide MFS transporter [Neiella holothuriorum]
MASNRIASLRNNKVLSALLNRRTIICLFTGFASGLPLFILVNLVPAWLRDLHVSLEEIGLLSLVMMPFAWKFLWAPLVDRFELPFLGLRRGWMLVTQILLLIGVACLPVFDVHQQIWGVAALATAVALFSATQDIVLDAYRREILPDEELGWGNSVHVNAYRIAALVPGSLALILADHMDWQQVFVITAAFMAVGIVLTLSVKEPQKSYHPHSFAAAVTEPFQEFIQRKGVKQALAVLAFIFLYKLGDNLATALSTPFYLDMGFSKTEIGLISKSAAIPAMIVGSLLGGIFMIRLGINRSLWVFGVVQMVSILGFAWLAQAGNDPTILAAVIAFEYFGVGLGTAALVAYMAKLTDIRYTATQLALFTAIAALPRSAANASTGFIVEAIGWEYFFYVCTLCAIPGMLMLIWAAPWRDDDVVKAESEG